MLPSLGLFQNIRCPALSHCKRPTCVFSHKQPSQEQKSSVTSASTPTTTTTTTTTTRKLPNTSTTAAASMKRPLPKTNTNDRTKLSKTSHPDTAKSTRNNASTATVGTSLAKDPHHRTAHTPSFTGPLTIKADISSHTALKVRQLITNKLYEQYIRIYPSSIHTGDPQLAAKRTQEHEQKILDTTTNTAGYKQQAMCVLMELKKQIVVTEPLPTTSPPSPLNNNNTTPSNSAAAPNPPPSAPPFRGKQPKNSNWRSTCPLLTDRSYLNSLILSHSQLDTMQYPTTTTTLLLNKDDGGKQEKSVKKPAQPQQQTCDRCNKTYTVKTILGAKESTACTYHFGRLRVSKSFGEKQRTYTCCGDPLGSIGCEKGPHVFKVEDIQKLHGTIPFVTVPETSTVAAAPEGKEKLLALDCEMGYTTIGMELIRLTVINANYELVLDELVLPSHMVIDLNSRYSGIDTLAGVRHNLASIRQALFDKMDQDTILLGHGLENDLKALRIIHDKVIDTSQLFPHPNGLPYRYGLRMLANKYLSKFIQEGSEGHDSFEDAATCLELVYHHHESLSK